MTTTTKVKVEATEVAVDYGEKVVERKRNLEGYTWGVLRLGMGWIFFWAFIDKLFGLGFATAPGDAWLVGGSPTFGFLNFGAKGPFVEFYNAIAGNVFVDWMFMFGLLVVGLPLLLGIGVKLAGYTGTLMLALMFTAASILPEHNPFLDEHIIYGVIMIGLAITGAGKWIGFGNWWRNTELVRRYPILE